MPTILFDLFPCLISCLDCVARMYVTRGGFLAPQVVCDIWHATIPGLLAATVSRDLLAKNVLIPPPAAQLARIWMHECDRLIDD